MGQFDYLLHDSLLIVIAQRAAELVVVHGWTVLLHAPQPGNLRRERSDVLKVMCKVFIIIYSHAAAVKSLQCLFIISQSVVPKWSVPAVAARGHQQQIQVSSTFFLSFFNLINMPQTRASPHMWIRFLF